MTKSLRIFSKYANPNSQLLVNSLKTLKNTPNYRSAMFSIGMELGNIIISKNPTTKYFYLVCTVEDTDFLAKGIMQCFYNHSISFNLACFWNKRETLKDGERISPVLRKYVEKYDPPQKSNPKMVIVKSIISGACVVKTNIKEIIENITPDKIIVTAPVMHIDAAAKLESEFNKSITKRFDYIYFAQDSKKEKNLVKPGIGDIYKRLGFKDQDTKNKYTPIVIKERRASYT